MLLLLPLPFYIGMLLDALAWKSMLSSVSKVGVFSLYGAQVSAEAVLLSVPGGFALSDPIKLYILKHRFQIPPLKAIGSLVTRYWLLGITQFLYICTACLLGFFATQYQLPASTLQYGPLFIAVVLLVCVSVLLGLIIRSLMHGTLACRVWKMLYAVKIRSLRVRLNNALGTFREADRCFAALGKRNALSILSAALFYILVWTMDVWETILVARATGIHISFISTLFVEAILSAVRLGMFFLPGGIGVKEIGYFALFSSFHLPVSAVQIGAFVVIKRLVSILCIMIGYFVLIGQGLGPIWKRASIVYQTMKEGS